MELIKAATRTAESNSSLIREKVADILKKIEADGETAVRELAKKHDKWEGDFVLGDAKKQRLIDLVPDQVKTDLKFAYDQVFGFAMHQKNSLKEFEVRPHPDMRLGQRILPVDVAGCYVPGGRFAHACSAIMSVATAKAAGVPCVIACSPPRGESINPAVVFAMDLAGADIILEIGGVQAIAAMAYGIFTGKPANILVGPGNAYVAEAKALIAGSGKCGIDVFAGPTESAVIADAGADPLTVAIDLVSQAEHGVDSPVWLFTDSRKLARDVLALMPELIAGMPNPEVPGAAWKNYGEIILCRDRQEICQVCDTYAPEHVQVIAADPNWWLQNLRAYGSLFLGEGSAVPHGDKCSGTNHILPTKKAGYHTGGLNVLKFLKICTYQEIGPASNKMFSAVASRLSRVEGMEGHARACDWRLQKFFPRHRWDFRDIHTSGNQPLEHTRKIAGGPVNTNNKTVFKKDFTRQEPIPETAVAQALEVLRSGRLHRYNTAPGEDSQTALLEQEFAAYMGKRFCLACASCGSAMYLALKSAGVKAGDTVLCNAFTLAPVPGAIENAGARIELVEITEDYTIDLEDLARKADKGDYLLLSHMRGHIGDMDEIVEICRRHNLLLIEDCAHTMGATWNGRKSGSFGHAACFSTQTYKHINSGEGGLLVSDDPTFIARAVIYSGSYMLYAKHLSRPGLDSV
jgi:sulfopropanediol 3-dehydrogenase